MKITEWTCCEKLAHMNSTIHSLILPLKAWSVFAPGFKTPGLLEPHCRQLYLLLYRSIASEASLGSWQLDYFTKSLPCSKQGSRTGTENPPWFILAQFRSFFFLKIHMLCSQCCLASFLQLTWYCAMQVNPTWEMGLSFEVVILFPVWRELSVI